MVATREGLALTQAHDLAQAKVEAEALRVATLVFRGALDPDDLDRSFPRYASTVEALVGKYRNDAAGLARAYYEALRRVEGVTAPMPNVPLPPSLAPEQIATSLLVTGPATIKRQVGQGTTIDTAVQVALQRTLGAVGRHVQNGHRDFLRSAVAADPASGGWSRVSRGKPCSFCAMLISRGPAYRHEGTADFRCHDHCHCQAVPFFDGSSGWTEQAVAADALWTESTKGLSGKEAVKAFATAYDSP